MNTINVSSQSESALKAFSIATDKEAVKCLKTPLKKGGYNFEERKVFWNSFFDFKAPKLRLPIHITKLSGKDGFSL